MAFSHLVITCLKKQGDRLLLYGPDPSYYVIAPLGTPGLGEGIAITYEPFGVNFGFFVALATTPPRASGPRAMEGPPMDPAVAPAVAEALTQIQLILSQIAASMQVIADNQDIMNRMQASTNRILEGYLAMLEHRPPQGDSDALS